MKYELKRGAIQLVAGMALFASASSLGAPAGEPRRNAPSVTIYDPDPNHPWNRVHACLLVRRANDDSEYGADTLDPLLWRETKHLLTGDSHRRALECLDEFLKGHAEKSITDPLKRAVFQRDLWAVFDWAAFGGNHPSTQRRALLARLALAMHRVALTPEEIRRLPETYSEAVASHHFSVEYSSTSPHRAFLPPTLFQPDGPWIGLSGYSDEPTAIGHFSGRSRFLIFMRLPGGREATLRYVRSLRSSTEPPSLDGGRGLNLKLPQFPAGTEVALVRQMMLIDGSRARPADDAYRYEWESYADRCDRECAAPGVSRCNIRTGSRKLRERTGQPRSGFFRVQTFSLGFVHAPRWRVDSRPAGREGVPRTIYIRG